MTPMTFPERVAARRSIGESPLLPLERRGRATFVEIDDFADLPAFRPPHHVAHDHRPLHGGFAAAVAQRCYMQKHVLQPGLARIIRYDEPVTLAGVEPLHPPADAH